MRRAAVGALFRHRVGFVLHGFLHEQPLQFQAGLTDMLLDEAQTLLGVLVQLLQTLPEVFPPAGQVLFQQRLLRIGEDRIDQAFNFRRRAGRAGGGQRDGHGHMNEWRTGFKGGLERG